MVAIQTHYRVNATATQWQVSDEVEKVQKKIIMVWSAQIVSIDFISLFKNLYLPSNLNQMLQVSKHNHRKILIMLRLLQNRLLY